jgi:hypothetical protein
MGHFADNWAEVTNEYWEILPQGYKITLIQE